MERDPVSARSPRRMAASVATRVATTSCAPCLHRTPCDMPLGMKKGCMTHWSRLFGNDEQISTARDMSSLLLRVGGLGLPFSETTLTSHLYWVSWGDALPTFQDRVLGLEF